MSTTVFATKRAVRDVLQAAGGDLDGIQVAYADPGDRRRRESIWLGPDVEDVEDEAVSLKPGTNRRNEEFRLHLFVEVIAPGSVEDVEARTETLVNAVLSTIDADPKLGRTVPGLLWIVGEGMDVATSETPDGPRVVVDIFLRVRSRP